MLFSGADDNTSNAAQLHNSGHLIFAVEIVTVTDRQTDRYKHVEAQTVDELRTQTHEQGTNRQTTAPLHVHECSCAAHYLHANLCTQTASLQKTTGLHVCTAINSAINV